MPVIDTNDNVSSHLSLLKAKGVTAVGRYYSSKAWKRLSKAEAALVSAAGIELFVVFENDGDPPLTQQSGVQHAQIALLQAKTVGQPEGSAIYFALEHLPNGYTAAHLPGIRDYVVGLTAGLGGRFKLGVYTDGVVCADLLQRQLCDYFWLSASRGFAGSKDFYASKKWSLAQDPHVDQNWDGLSIDLNEATADFGAFSIGAPAIALHEALAVTGPAIVAGAAGFPATAAAVAAKEWDFFGNQTFDLAGRTTHAGHKEGDPGFFDRVGTYWLVGTNTNGLDGRDHDSPWSATFISWVTRTAGAGMRFRYSTLHSVYISQGIRDFAQQRASAGYWTRRLGDAVPKVGDLVCWAREAGVDYDNQKGGDYKAHSDLVVEVADNHILIIGGNVGNSVTKRPLARSADGTITPVVENGETLFALMQCRL